MIMIYYIYIENKQVGSLSLEELTWHEDQTAWKWKDAKDFEELKTFLSRKLCSKLVISRHEAIS